MNHLIIAWTKSGEKILQIHELLGIATIDAVPPSLGIHAQTVADQRFAANRPMVYLYLMVYPTTTTTAAF